MNGSTWIRARLPLLLCLALHLATALPAQQVCDGYNHQSNAAQPYNVPLGTEVAILYAVPTNAPAIVDQVQLWFPQNSSPTGPISLTPARGTIRLESPDPLTGLPSGGVIVQGTFSGNGGSIISIGNTWSGPTITPTTLSAGQLIWVVYTVAPFATAMNLGVENGGPDAVTSSVNTGAGFGPLSLANQFKLRFRSVNCNPPGTNPTWLTVGTGCLGSNGLTPSLTPSAPPALGTSLNLNVVNGVAGGNAHLFFSVGVTAGAPLTLPNGCPLWLDVPTFIAAVQSGANPLLQVPIDILGNASFPVTVPNDVSLIGVGVGLQVALDDPVQGYAVTEAELALIGW